MNWYIPTSLHHKTWKNQYKPQYLNQYQKQSQKTSPRMWDGLRDSDLAGTVLQTNACVCVFVE